MGFEIELRPRARKSYRALDARTQKQITAKIDSLRDWPDKHADTAKLKSKKNTWRLRVGDYRVIFSPKTKERTIHVLRIAHRRDIYLH